jgi:peptidyl-prolyl cis-trans isomerase C
MECIEMRRPYSYASSLVVLFCFSLLASSCLACSNDAETDPASSKSGTEQSAESASAEGQAASSPQEPAAQQPVDPQSFPEIVAKVSDTEIKRTDLIVRADMIGSQLQIPVKSVDFYRKVLDEIVGTELLHRASVEKGYTPSDSDIQSQLDSIRARFPDEATFTKQLANEGMTLDQLRVRMSRDMSVQKFIDTEVAPRAQVTEEAKKKFYSENGDQMTRPEQAHVSHILIKVDAGATAEARDQAKQKAEDLRQQIQAGGDFAALARENSDDPGSKANGGDLSWVSRGQTVPPFEAAAFALKPGEISGIVETQFGYHIIKLAELRPSSLMPYEEVAPRIEQFLGQQRIQEEIETEVETLKTKTKVEIFI